MTGCDRVLHLLRDGQWHTHHEGYALNLILHSRISDLRKRGHVIERGRDGDLYLYRLLSSPPSGEAGLVPVLPTVEPGPQLSLLDAA